VKRGPGIETALPTAFETNGDYVVATQTATSPDLTTHPVVSVFSEVGVQSTAIAATKVAFGGGAKNIGQAIAVQSNGQVVLGGMVRIDTNGGDFSRFAESNRN
jgi:hypothetical protein